MTDLRRSTTGLLAIVVAYLAGVWNGLTDSWWVVAAASLLMIAATCLVLWGSRHA